MASSIVLMNGTGRVTNSSSHIAGLIEQKLSPTKTCRRNLAGSPRMAKTNFVCAQRSCEQLG
jgi:hypothetical protein